MFAYLNRFIGRYDGFGFIIGKREDCRPLYEDSELFGYVAAQPCSCQGPLKIFLCLAEAPTAAHYLAESTKCTRWLPISGQRASCFRELICFICIAEFDLEVGQGSQGQSLPIYLTVVTSGKQRRSAGIKCFSQLTRILKSRNPVVQFKDKATNAPTPVIACSLQSIKPLLTRGE